MKTDTLTPESMDDESRLDQENMERRQEKRKKKQDERLRVRYTQLWGAALFSELRPRVPYEKDGPR